MFFGYENDSNYVALLGWLFQQPPILHAIHDCHFIGCRRAESDPNSMFLIKKL